MKKIVYALVAMTVVAAFQSCDNYETYGEKKDKEREAIQAFLNDSAINVISETAFSIQGDSTSVEKNEYVYLSKTGVYMQIVRKGCGTKLEENKQVNVLCRYLEYNIIDKVIQTYNLLTERKYEKMSVTRVSGTYTASFASGVMYETYGASVPSGWLVPLQYILLGRQSDPGNEIARVKLIVPHTQGQSYATSNVYPCYYEITYQRER